MSTDLTQYRSDPISPRRRPEVVDVRDARRPGAQALIRTQAGHLIARAGLAYAEELTEREVAACRRAGPVIDERAREIVDGFVKLVRTELILLPYGGE